MKLSIVIGYRNREIDRVKRCIDSLVNQTRNDFEIILIDYGSEVDKANAVKRLIQDYTRVLYLYIDTRGQFWNRAHCLNIGIKAARGRFVLTTDIDIIFHSDFVDRISGSLRHDSVIHTYTYYLPPGSFNIDLPAHKLEKQLSYGICSCIQKDKLMSIGGYDEYYCIWGAEDRDLKNRLTDSGIKEVIIDDMPMLYHQWHPPTDLNEEYIPYNLWSHLYERLYLSKSVAKSDQSFGEHLHLVERPILKLVNKIDNLDINKLEIINEDWASRNAIKRLYARFLKLKHGQMLLIKNLNQPNVGRLTTQLISIANKIISSYGVNLDYTQNPLRDATFDLLINNRSLIKDYYWSAADKGYVILERSANEQY